MQERSTFQANRSSAPAGVPNLAGLRGPVAAWLLHGADPLGSDLDPPGAPLSARQLRKLYLKANALKVLPSVLRHYPVPDDDAEIEQIRAEADTWRVEAAALSAMLKHHAGAIADAASGLPVALVKGPAFAVLYPQGLRPFGDIDLLAAPSALPTLASILWDQGFRRLTSDPLRLEDAWIHRDNSVLMVEVHTNLVHSRRMRDAFSLTYDDLAGHFDRPSALLSIAVMHGSMHFFAWLRHVVDILQAARALVTVKDESLFETFTDRTGTRIAAIAGLNLAHRLFGENRCLEIARSLGAPRDYRFARTLIEGAVLTAPMEGRIVYNGWRRFIFRELLRQGTLSASGNGAQTIKAASAPAATSALPRCHPNTRGTRVVAFTISRHRPLMLRHCIMQMQHQSYPVDHVIYVNSQGEQTGSITSLNYGVLLEDLCRGCEGRLNIAYGRSGTYHQNCLNALRLAQLEDYDLFLKVDDDDIYLKDYVLGVVTDFEKNRWDYSGSCSRGHLNGYRWKPDAIMRGLGLAEQDFALGIPDVMPPTTAFSRRAIGAVLTLKDNGSSDAQWRRHLARVPGLIMRVRDDRNFIYNVHGGNISTASWYKP
jgi:hypothetical protein